jgi:AcrR family transcriptional regulator
VGGPQRRRDQSYFLIGMMRKSSSKPAKSPAAGTRSSKGQAKPVRIATYAPGTLREALVSEGRRMFEENGAAELSMRELARRVGVSEAAPSKHFQGKEELLAAIACDGFRELGAQRATLSREKLDPFAKAKKMMMSYVRFAQLHEGLFDLMIGPRVLPEFRRGEYLDAADTSYGMFAQSIFDLGRAHGWPPESLEYLSHAAWATEHGIAALILADRVPREDSGLELQNMIEFSITFFLERVSAGPKKFLAAGYPHARAPAPLR